MIEIQRYDYDKVWGMEKHELGDYVDYDDHKAIVAQLETHLAEARKDQARYKWVVRDFDRAEMKLDDYLYAYFDSLDDFIDAAIKEQQ